MPYNRGNKFSKSSRTTPYTKDEPHPQGKCYHQPSNANERNIVKMAERIRNFAWKRFVQVETEEGELLMGYLTYTSMVYYFRPAMMTWVSMHTVSCDCKMCEQVWDPEPHPAIGRRSPSNTEHPDTYPRNPSPSAPPYSPATPTGSMAEWIEIPGEPTEPTQVAQTPQSPPPEEQGWPRCPTPDEWNEIPTTITRELEPTPCRDPRPQPSIRELLDTHKALWEEIAKMDPNCEDICPGIPPYNPKRGSYKLQEAVRLTRRAKQLLEEISLGHSSRGGAYLEWILLLAKCPHGMSIYSASHVDDCAACHSTVRQLNSYHQHGWIRNHIQGQDA